MYKNPRSLEEFQSYLTESIFSKIKILEKILGNRHWLTTGIFKEKVLIEFLNKQLPKKIKAKSGFVIFPCERIFENKQKPSNFDELNASSYEVSKQIDIILYNNDLNITIYEDDDIVILPPEATISGIIEVKGILSHKHLNGSIQKLNDYSLKWIKYKMFMESHYMNNDLLIPKLYIFCWEKAKSYNKKFLINEPGIRNKLTKNFINTFPDKTIDEVPKIDSLSIFNISITSITHYSDEEGVSVGYISSRGKVSLVDDENNIKTKGELTLFSLLRDILVNNNLLNNRFVIDVDETNLINIEGNKNFGYNKIYNI